MDVLNQVQEVVDVAREAKEDLAHARIYAFVTVGLLLFIAVKVKNR